MNRRVVLGAALCALATVWMLPAAQAASLAQIKARGTLRVALANEIPYGYMHPSGDAQGAGPEVAKLIADELGIAKVEWIAAQFSALIPGLRADQFDMVAAEMAILPERCRQVLYSEPNSSYGEGLLVAAGNPSGVRSYEDFTRRKDLKIAIMAGADQLDMMQQLGVGDDRIVTIARNADAISTLTAGRAAAYAATGLTVKRLAGQSPRVAAVTPFTDPVIDGEKVRSWGGFVFAPDNAGLRDAVNQALAKIKQGSQWREILTRHGFSAEDLRQAGLRDTRSLCAAD